jgi:hypothetical protein
MLTKNNVAVFVISFIISIAAGFFGLNFSFHYDFPAGSSIVAVLGGIFILSSIYKLISAEEGREIEQPANKCKVVTMLTFLQSNGTLTAKPPSAASLYFVFISFAGALNRIISTKGNSGFNPFDNSAAIEKFYIANNDLCTISGQKFCCCAINVFN